MSVPVIVPELGESVSEATIGRWLKKEGDSVQRGEPLVELETDKVDVEVSSQSDGMLSSIKHPAGDSVSVGDEIGTIDEQQSQRGTSSGEESPSADAGRQTNESKSSSGDGAGEKEEKVSVSTESEEAEQESTPSSEESTEAEEEESRLLQKTTPVARRMAREKDIDLTLVKGSGDDNRITKRDIERFEEEPTLKRDDREPEIDEPSKTPAPSAGPRLEERYPMSRRRRTIARRLVESQRASAMLSTFNEIDMSTVLDIRARHNPAFEERHGVRLGIVSFFVKASIGALRAFPRLNAEIEGEDIIVKHYYDIGVAVGASDGLVVPVIRDADRKPLADIEKQIKNLSEKAHDKRLSIEELQGGTFTISNGGVFGSLLSTPILNPPQVGILGLHKIEERPYVVGGQIEIRPLMYVALSYDHRIVDGLEAVQFLTRIKELIERPEMLLMEG
jgi:2-oxoglutarate dehydrogenase E2 component (dihydrolipoamide succinyltransferase)